MKTYRGDIAQARGGKLLKLPHSLHTLKRPEYISEFGQFMDQFLEQHPEVIVDQRKGWKIFWDKKVNFSELDDLKEGSIPMKPYEHD